MYGGEVYIEWKTSVKYRLTRLGFSFVPYKRRGWGGGGARVQWFCSPRLSERPMA
jgi:hypothetical protein